MPAATTTKASRRNHIALFARNFFKHPKMLGSIIPSSRFLINRVLQLMDWNRARVIVEYGPGVGTFTEEILSRMRSDAVLVAIETNTDFVRQLREDYPDSRLHVVHGSAADVQQVLKVRGFDKADYVLSGIPFTTLAPEVRKGILHATRDVLRPDGAFIVYQFNPNLFPQLQKVFSTVRRDFEPLNVLPAQIFHSRP